MESKPVNVWCSLKSHTHLYKPTMLKTVGWFMYAWRFSGHQKLNVKQNSGIKKLLRNTVYFPWGSGFSSYEIELRNRVTQNDVTLRVTNSKVFIESLLSNY